MIIVTLILVFWKQRIALNVLTEDVSSAANFSKVSRGVLMQINLTDRFQTVEVRSNNNILYMNSVVKFLQR